MNVILYSYKKTLLGCPGGLAGKTRGNGNINGLVFPLSLSPFSPFNCSLLLRQQWPNSENAFLKVNYIISILDVDFASKCLAFWMTEIQNTNH